MTSVVQRKTREEGYVRPKSAKESREDGYTGEACPACGSLTLKERQNFTQKYLQCEDCPERIPIGPI